MTATSWTSRWTARRAARFADLVDAAPVHVVPEYLERTDPRLEELLTTVGALRSIAVELDRATPTARPAFVADLRERLMVEADTALVPTQERLILTRQTGRRRPARLAAAATALVLAGGTAGVAVAAENSLPGQSLYTLKQGMESTARTLQLSQADRGRYELHQASNRLDEVTALVARGDNDQVSATLTRFSASSGSGADGLFTAYQADSHTGDVADVRAFATSAMTQLDTLGSRVPAADMPQLRKAAALVSSLDQEAQVLCAQCGGGRAVAMPASLGIDVPAPIELPAAADAAAQEARQLSVKQAGGAAAGASSSTSSSGPAPASGADPPGVPALPTAAASGATKQLTGTVSGVVKSALPKVVGSKGASPVSAAVSGALDAASGLVDGTISGATNPAGGLLGTPKPKP